MRDKEEIIKLSEYFTIKEASEFIGVSKDTLRRWESKGKIKSIRNPMNRYRLYKQEDLKNLLKIIEGNIINE
jgi:DNA (cytosine-5)-methyltransferase 1